MFVVILFRLSNSNSIAVAALCTFSSALQAVDGSGSDTNSLGDGNLGGTASSAGATTTTTTTTTGSYSRDTADSTDASEDDDGGARR